ncbi:hypothetical protein Dda_0158 [Drechslerella dactyloides]|uniref:Uncharacterized protein n=1 Tax=Drechslerella dactyloides TaxID=74499 RepID=A0AAD6J5P8_DREDA|nr:hypothetical protein Dda_0158 [Drechslerella dactyloides]
MTEPSPNPNKMPPESTRQTAPAEPTPTSRYSSPSTAMSPSSSALRVKDGSGQARAIGLMVLIIVAALAVLIGSYLLWRRCRRRRRAKATLPREERQPPASDVSNQPIWDGTPAYSVNPRQDTRDIYPGQEDNIAEGVLVNRKPAT